jgi:hypothetical protein
MRATVLVVLLAAPLLAIAAPPGKPGTGCCQQRVPESAKQDVERLHREGRRLQDSPQIHARLLRALDQQFKDMGISSNDSRLASLLAVNPPAVLREVERLRILLAQDWRTEKEKGIARASWPMLEMASPAIRSLVKDEREAAQSRQDVEIAIEVSRMVAALEANGHKPFTAKYVHALQTGAKAQEALEMASDGRVSLTVLRRSFKAAALLPVAAQGQPVIFAEHVDGQVRYHASSRSTSPRGPDLPQLVDEASAQQSLRTGAQLWLDVSMFDANGVPRTVVRAGTRVADGGRYQLLAEVPEVMQTVRPPPSLIARIKGCCLFGRPPHGAERMAQELGRIRFEPANVRVASLFIDSSTEVALSSGPIARARVRGDAAALRTPEDLQRVFEQARGKMLVLLGHVEDADYVVRTSSNAEQFRLPIQRVRAMAREANVQLVDVGCSTTRAIDAESIGFGVLTPYNSVQAVRSLERALESSGNLQDFFVNMSSEGLKIVVEPSFIREKEKTASIFSRLSAAGSAVWLRVAQVTFSL